MVVSPVGQFFLFLPGMSVVHFGCNFGQRPVWTWSLGRVREQQLVRLRLTADQLYNIRLPLQGQSNISLALV